MNIGVLAIQGGFAEHITMLQQLHVEGILIKKVSDLEHIDGLILPGGESTAMAKQMIENGLLEAIKTKILEGLPVLGTCAGLILLSKEVNNQPVPTLGVMDIKVKRNAFGRQVDSFVTSATIARVSESPLELVFIRAPYIEDVGDHVEVLCRVNDVIVAAQQDNMLAIAFHPELNGIDAIHTYFIDTMIKKGRRTHGSISHP